MMRLSIGYPLAEEELRMAHIHIEGKTPDQAEPVIDKEAVLSVKKEVEGVHISDGVLSYAQRIVDGTRRDPGLSLGASPRALLHLLFAARAKAYLDGRGFVKPDDVKHIALPVLSHRLSLTTEMRLHNKKAEDILDTLILKTPLPVE
jgi:MoxR-like ATPase